jgi:hypothetical protein
MKFLFQAKAGHFGERGWKDINFWKWLWFLLEGGWVIRFVVEV